MRLSSGSRLIVSWETALLTHQRTTWCAANRKPAGGVAAGGPLVVWPALVGWRGARFIEDNVKPVVEPNVQGSARLPLDNFSLAACG